MRGLPSRTSYYVPAPDPVSYNSPMEIVHLTAHTNADGHLAIDTPIRDREVEITIREKEADPWDGAPRDALGWPVGFWERFAGAYPGVPDEPEELPMNEPRL